MDSCRRGEIMNQNKVNLLKEAIKQKRPEIKGVNCQKCGKPLPPMIMHGVGKIVEHFESARHFLAKCRECDTWHRFDEATNQWVADEQATQLATTKYAK